MIKKTAKASAIRDVLQSVFTRLEKEKLVSRETVDTHWRTAAGARAFGHSRPASLKKKVLTVRVDSSGWMQTLVLEKRKILKQLKRAIGKDKIADIHFRIGEF